MFKALIQGASESAKEMSEMERLLSPENKTARKIVFYAERPIDWRYYVDYVEHLLTNPGVEICYITSNIKDPIFATSEKRIKPFFIKNALGPTFAKLDSKVLVMTTPDLNQGFVKRAPDPVQHIYAYHGISSVHQCYRLGGLDHFDSLLCIGQYQIDELRKQEEVYKLKKRDLPLVGYPLLERIYREHQAYLASKTGGNQAPIVLVAPTWDPARKSSIMDCCIDELVDVLARTGMTVWLRPHPEFVKRFPKVIESVQKRIDKHKYTNISFQMALESMQCLHEADVLITDHSTIAVDYALGTERPVLFIDTPIRIDNPERDKLGMEPVENKYRSKLGVRVKPGELDTVPTVLKEMIQDRPKFAETVPALRDIFVANWLSAGQIGGDYILSLV